MDLFSTIWQYLSPGLSPMFETVDTFFKGDGTLIAIYAGVLGTILFIAAVRTLKKITTDENVHYFETEYQRENTSELFVAPKQIDTSY